MTKIIIPVILLILVYLTGCSLIVAIKETPGFYSGYKNLTPEQKELVHKIPPDSTVNDILTNKNDIYAITAKHLTYLLQQFDTTVVYEWNPSCSSPYCISVTLCKLYCEQKKYQLIVLTEDYSAFEQMKDLKEAGILLYTINSDYYKTDYCPRYEKLFFKELDGNDKFKKEENYYRFKIFAKGNYIRSKRDIYE